MSYYYDGIPTVGARVDKLRIEHGDSQAQLADYLGYAKSHMSDLINDKKQWTYEAAEKVATRYGVTVDYILTGVTDSEMKLREGISLEVQAHELLIEMRKLGDEERNHLGAVIVRRILEMMF